MWLDVTVVCMISERCVRSKHVSQSDPSPATAVCGNLAMTHAGSARVDPEGGSDVSAAVRSETSLDSLAARRATVTAEERRCNMGSTHTGAPVNNNLWRMVDRPRMANVRLEQK